MEPTTIILIVILSAIGLSLLGGAIVINREYERAIRFRLGKHKDSFGPGIHFKIPIIDSVSKVDIRRSSVDVQPQDVLTKDNVSISIDAVVFYKVKKDIKEVCKAIIQVDDFEEVTLDYGQTMLRDKVGKMELDEILQNKDELSEEIEDKLDKRTDDFGVKVVDVEIKDVNLPDNMQRAMAQEAEAERERRAKIKNAQGELESSIKMRAASEIMGSRGYRLRTLKTLDQVAQENSTIIGFPLEMIGGGTQESEEVFGDQIKQHLGKKSISGLLGSEKIAEELDLEQELGFKEEDEEE